MTTAIPPEALIVMKSGLVSAEIDGNMVIMDIATGQYVAIGGPGAMLVELLKAKPRHFDELCRAAGERYEVDEARCIRDIGEFVNRLRGEGLAQIEERR